LIKSRFLVNLGVVEAEVSVCDRVVAVTEEEAGVEAVAEETGSSSIDGCGGDQQSREQCLGDWRGLRVLGWKWNDTGRDTIYMLKNINSDS
jgi:hypothetical protein